MIALISAIAAAPISASSSIVSADAIAAIASMAIGSTSSPIPYMVAIPASVVIVAIKAACKASNAALSSCAKQK